MFIILSVALTIKSRESDSQSAVVAPVSCRQAVAVAVASSQTSIRLRLSLALILAVLPLLPKSLMLTVDVFAELSHFALATQELIELRLIRRVAKS